MNRRYFLRLLAGLFAGLAIPAWLLPKTENRFTGANAGFESGDFSAWSNGLTPGIYDGVSVRTANQDGWFEASFKTVTEAALESFSVPAFNDFRGISVFLREPLTLEKNKWYQVTIKTFNGKSQMLIDGHLVRLRQ